MNREERIRELIRKSDATTNPETDKRILGDAVEHLAELRQEESAAQSRDGISAELAS